MAPHQQRVVEEKAELDTRLDKLRSFINTGDFDQVDSAERARLIRQAMIMTDYSRILSDRIEAFI